MKIKNFITQYLKDLPNRWSANFLAYLAFNNLLLAIIGSISTIIYEILGTKDSLIPLFELPLYIISYAIAFLPISCILSFISLYSYRKLLTTNNSKKFNRNLITISIILLIIYILVIPFFNFNTGTSIYIIFIPFIFFWLPIGTFMIYLFLYFKENNKNFQLTNSILIKNKYYKKCLKFFFLYGFILFGIIEILLLLIGLFLFKSFS